MNYEVFTINNNEITVQTVINGLLVTPYNDGIAVTFNNNITLSCPLINNIVLKFDKYIIYVEDSVFYVGVSNG
jgi:hypothetical protein